MVGSLLSDMGHYTKRPCVMGLIGSYFMVHTFVYPEVKVVFSGATGSICYMHCVSLCTLMGKAVLSGATGYI